MLPKALWVSETKSETKPEAKLETELETSEGAEMPVQAVLSSKRENGMISAPKPNLVVSKDQEMAKAKQITMSECQALSGAASTNPPHET